MIELKQKDNKMADGIKSLVGKRVNKKFKFMDTDILIYKLTLGEVMEIQEEARKLKKTADSAAKEVSEKDEADDGFGLLKVIIRNAVEGASDLSDDDFKSLPLDELNKLSSEIMKFSGVNAEAGK